MLAFGATPSKFSAIARLFGSRALSRGSPQKLDTAAEQHESDQHEDERLHPQKPSAAG